ncbi:hypothetical protein DL98DRAFT_639730 [Cadophora sp. DSE1049]|nr:hypothetical protein DL98DRAFT_639730 [Cadophora sp. DSE1049]
MPISLFANENPAGRNTDPLSHYSDFYSLLEKYQRYRDEDKILVSKEAFVAAQRILDIDEDVKVTYGNDTEDLDVERETCAGMVAHALNHYRRKIRLFGWSIEPKVLRHAQRLVDEGRESDDIEERQRQELLDCRTSFKAARDATLLHLGSYMATLRRHNETYWGLEKPVDNRVLAAVEAISKWADGDHGKVTTDKFLRSINLRNWGYAGYTAKIASVYYWALRKADEVVDREVLLAVQEVMDLADEAEETEED